MIRCKQRGGECCAVFAPGGGLCYQRFYCLPPVTGCGRYNGGTRGEKENDSHYAYPRCGWRATRQPQGTLLEAVPRGKTKPHLFEQSPGLDSPEPFTQCGQKIIVPNGEVS